MEIIWTSQKKTLYLIQWPCIPTIPCYWTYFGSLRLKIVEVLAVYILAILVMGRNFVCRISLLNLCSFYVINAILSGFSKFKPPWGSSIIESWGYGYLDCVCLVCASAELPKLRFTELVLSCLCIMMSIVLLFFWFLIFDLLILPVESVLPFRDKTDKHRYVNII